MNSERMQYMQHASESEYFPLYSLFIGDKTYATVEWKTTDNTFNLTSFVDMTEDDLFEVVEILRAIRKENNV